MTSCNLLAPSLRLYVSLINSGKKENVWRLSLLVNTLVVASLHLNQTHIMHGLFSHDGSLISVSCLWSLFWQVSDGLSGREGRDDDYPGLPSVVTPLMTHWRGWHLADQDITLDNYWWQWITLTAALAPAHSGATLRYSEIKTRYSLPGGHWHWTLDGCGVSHPPIPPLAPAPTPGQRPTPAPDTFSRRG